MTLNDDAIMQGVIRSIRVAKEMSGDAGEYEIGLDSKLIKAPLSMGSLDYVAMMVNLEEQFGIIATDEDFAQESVATVGDLVDMVRRLVTSGQD
jgi:acyl carrier protein